MASTSTPMATSTAILIGSIIISISILMAGDVLKLKHLEAKTNALGAATNNTVPTVNNPTNAATPAPAITGPVKVSVDDDPVLGKKDAPITIIEFSDYECPFCKKHFTQTYPSLKKDYIDTGKVKLVYRDFPLSFHDPNATEQAIAANCAREQGGDAKYFEFHDEIFTLTTSNKTFPKDQLYPIADKLKLNAAQFKTCLDSNKYADEVKKDVADGAALDVEPATPTFWIGKSTDSGVIEGFQLKGAYPYENFKQRIDQLLQS